MKQLIAFALFIFLLSACKKDKQLGQQFAGKWEFENFSGYPFNNNFQAPGNGNIIVLSTDGSFERRKFDTVLFRGTYSVTEKKDCLSRTHNWYFSTSESNSTDRYIDFEGNRLTFSTPNCFQDGGTAYYRKLE